MTTVAIWKKFEARLYAFILKQVEDMDLAKDILQDVFEKIHIHIHSLESEAKLESWIFTITRNAITDHYRAQKRLPELQAQSTYPEFGKIPNSQSTVIPNSDAKDSMREDLLLNCLDPFIDSLPSPYKEVLVESQFLKIPQKEIAKKHAVQHATIRSQVSRAKKMLRQKFLDCCKEQIMNSDVEVKKDCSDTRCLP